MKKTEFLVGVLALGVIILGTLLLVRLVLIRNLVDLDPLKRVKAWEIYLVEESNTRVWCLARRVANNHYDITGVSSLISEKNNLKGDYNLQPGQKILLPVFKEARSDSRGFLSVKKRAEKDGTEEIVVPGGSR